VYVRRRALTFEAEALTLDKHKPERRSCCRASTDEVAAIVRWARAHGVPVTARGAGTGLAGGATPEHGGIVLSVNPHGQLLRVDAERMLAWVQPGLVNLALSQRSRDARPLLRARSGVAAGQHGGRQRRDERRRPHCLKYGVTLNTSLGVVACSPTAAS
jgi:glycolate oxidase